MLNLQFQTDAGGNDAPPVNTDQTTSGNVVGSGISSDSVQSGSDNVLNKIDSYVTNLFLKGSTSMYKTDLANESALNGGGSGTQSTSKSGVPQNIKQQQQNASSGMVIATVVGGLIILTAGVFIFRHHAKR